MRPALSPPGFGGKLPAYADFIEGGGAVPGRRALAGWAQQAIVGVRRRRGGGFDDAFLTMPIWRFAVGKGVFGPAASVGIICPSMDRSGRAFPFFILSELPSAPDLTAVLRAAGGWLAQMEDLALDLLDPQASTKGLTLAAPALDALPREPRAKPAKTEPPLLACPVDAEAAPAALEARRQGVWATLGAVGAEPRGLAHAGAPSPALLDALMDAAPEAHAISGGSP